MPAMPMERLSLTTLVMPSARTREAPALFHPAPFSRPLAVSCPNLALFPFASELLTFREYLEERASLTRNAENPESRLASLPVASCVPTYAASVHDAFAILVCLLFAMHVVCGDRHRQQHISLVIAICLSSHHPHHHCHYPPPSHPHSPVSPVLVSSSLHLSAIYVCLRGPSPDDQYQDLSVLASALFSLCSCISRRSSFPVHLPSITLTILLPLRVPAVPYLSPPRLRPFTFVRGPGFPRLSHFICTDRIMHALSESSPPSLLMLLVKLIMLAGRWLRSYYVLLWTLVLFVSIHDHGHSSHYLSPSPVPHSPSYPPSSPSPFAPTA
ncbi:hypothetical protein V8D89_003520 [Ganoderma adspersum]